MIRNSSRGLLHHGVLAVLRKSFWPQIVLAFWWCIDYISLLGLSGDITFGCPLGRLCRIVSGTGLHPQSVWHFYPADCTHCLLVVVLDLECTGFRVRLPGVVRFF